MLNKLIDNTPEMESDPNNNNSNYDKYTHYNNLLALEEKNLEKFKHELTYPYEKK